MVSFPSWVTAPNDHTACGSEEAGRRLRFLVIYSSIMTNEQGSIASFSKFCDIERTQVYEAMREGRFSPKMAAKIEKACGRDVVRREWLVYPLEIHELTH